MSQCATSPSDPACVQMSLVGMSTRPPTSSPPQTSLPTFAALQPQAKAFQDTAYQNYTQTGMEMETKRRVNICELDIALDIWTKSNSNQDALLTSNEFDGAIMAASAILRLNRAVSQTPIISVMEDMLETISNGQYVTYSEFVTIIQSYFVVNC